MEIGGSKPPGGTNVCELATTVQPCAAAKMVSVLHLLSIREGARGFLISFRASNRYSRSYLENLEAALALLAAYAEENHWPPLQQVTTEHLEEYLTYLQDRPKWFGDRSVTDGSHLSQSYIETQYRRLKRFWSWLKERGHAECNILDLIPHPHIDERIIPTVADREATDVLDLVDPRRAQTPKEHFRLVRNRAVLLVLMDTPGRRSEIGLARIDDVDLEAGMLKVMGKGRRERRMPLGAVALEALWVYLQARTTLSSPSRALWVTDGGKSMTAMWLYRMVKRLGERVGISDLHTHRFRHSYATTALRGGMPERILMIVGGWKKIPDTYFRTLNDEDAIEAHRAISPADRLAQNGLKRGRQREPKARGRL